MALTQEKRLLMINTPLGDGAFLLTSLTGEEQLSRLFSYHLELVSENEAVAPEEIVGKNVTFAVQRPDESPRYFNGFVNRFSNMGRQREDLTLYRAEVVPWLWFLTRTADCRIFQEMTVVEIIEKIFGDLGFSDFETSAVRGTHPKWNYCVQYRETDFNFFSRLTEHEGIFYSFRHEDGKHTLVLADDKTAYKALPESEVPYTRDIGSQFHAEHITDWEHQYEFRPGKVAQTDYNFETPSTDLMTRESSIVKLPGIDKYEVYDYPGGYESKNGNGRPGEALTRVRMEEEEAPYDVVQGESSCKTFTPGGKFTITQHPNSSEEGKSFVITSIEHRATNPVETRVGGTADESYANRFECIPEAVTFRPARKTRKPVVQGPQTAVVVGPAGEEIYPDKYGRVKVQFYWDREGKKDENSSCWIRVSQVHAGKGFGGIDIPRIGEEVVVSFLEGNPDAPLITGRVYNAERMPPYGLPDKMNVSGMKSNSTKGGGGYNEFIMDDTKDDERITVHAQYNMDTTVENDQTTTVHNNRTDTIDVDDSETVGSNQTIQIGSDQKLEVGANQKTTIGSNQTTSVGAARSTNVGAGDELNVGGKQSVGVSGPISITSATSITLTAGGSSIEIGPSGITLTSAGVITEKAALVKHNA